MSKILQFKAKDKKGKVENAGFMEIKNKTEDSVDLYLYGDIVSDEWYKYSEDDKCPSDIAKFLSELERVNTIRLHINSGGGSVFGGMAIYNLLKSYKATVIAYIDGIAASIASVIAFAADKIIMYNNSTLMIHKPMNSYFFSMLNADELRKDADTLDVIQKTIVNSYMNKAKEGITEEQINAYVNAETWFTADEASEIFDIQIEESVEAVACASNFYTNYRNVPDNLKPESGQATVDIEKLADAIVNRVNQKLVSNESNDDIKKQILEDLCLYGA